MATKAPSSRQQSESSRSLKTASLASQVAMLIEEDCITSGLRPGDSLPSEGKFAEEFGVSRVVVREAMRSVEAHGVIRRQQGKRAILQEPNMQPIEDYVTRSAHMDKRNALELMEVRKALESHAARLSAQQLIDHPDQWEDTISAARKMVVEMRECRADPVERAALDMRFHHLLAGMCGNSMLAQMLGALDRPLHDSREQNHRASINAGAPDSQWADEHDELLDALTSEDPLHARQAMEEHLNLSLREVESRPDAVDDPDGTSTADEFCGPEYTSRQP